MSCRWVFLALALVLAGWWTCPAFAAGGRAVELHRFSLREAPTAFGWSNLAALAAGDVDGDGRRELVVSFPAGPDPVEAPSEDRAIPFQLKVFRLVPGSVADGPLAATPVTSLGPFSLTLNRLVVADVYPVNPPEIWFAYLPQVAALEFDGQSYQVLNGWQTWANKPVVLSWYGPAARGAEKLLAFAYRYSPEVAVGLITVAIRVKCPSKDLDLLPSAFFSPKDRLLAVDLDGDGREELLAAYSRLSRQFPPRPFTVTDLWSGREKAVLDGVYADGVAAGDVDGDRRLEVLVVENRLDEAGQPVEGTVTVLRWVDGKLSELSRLSYPRAWVADLVVGDLNDDQQDDLVVALLEQPKSSPEVVLKVLLL